MSVKRISWYNRNKHKPEVREKAREISRQWYIKNKVHAAECATQWRLNNPDKSSAIRSRHNKTAKAKQQWIKDNNKKQQRYPERQRLNQIHLRAQRKGIQVTITEDFLLTLRNTSTHCPVFGMPLVYGVRLNKTDDSAQLDRIDNTRGYTPDNVWFLSQRANRIKNDSTLDELKLLVSALNTRLL